MMTAADNDRARCARAVATLPPPDAFRGIAPAVTTATFGGFVRESVILMLPPPEVEVEVERYRDWPITWEAGFGFAAQLSCHADDCLGWCDTIEEIREAIDDEIADRRRSYGSHFREDTPALDDTFHRIEMDI